MSLAPSIGRMEFCNKAPKTPMNPIWEPTERSIWRETITRTMPHDMIPTTATCSDRLKRLRGVRKVPPGQGVEAEPDGRHDQQHGQQPDIQSGRHRHFVRNDPRA